MIKPTLTFDVEDSRRTLDLPARYDVATREVLRFLGEQEVRGTFFVVGTLAERDLGLVRDIVESGHELALHGWDHDALDRKEPGQLHAELARGKAVLEDVSGQPCLGFRAPVFSLVPATRWAVEVIHDAGFSYSSSVMPARNPLYGDPDAPRFPFRWPNGLVELPCTVRKVGPMTVPFLGGIYLRSLPRWFVRRSLSGLPPGTAPWVYAHPYDFDPDERFHVMNGATWLTSRLLFSNRRKALAKLGAVIAGGVAPPLGARVQAGEFAGAQVVSGP